MEGGLLPLGSRLTNRSSMDAYPVSPLFKVSGPQHGGRWAG